MKQRVLYIILFLLSSFPSVFGQVWTYTYDDYTTPNHAYRILPMPDSTMMVLINEEAGRDTFQMRLIRITEEGEVIMQYNLGEGLGMAFIQTYDGHFLVAGARYEDRFTTQAFALKFDLEGLVLWERAYEEGYIMCAIETSEHHLLLGGNLGQPGTSSNSMLYKTDEEGVRYWSRDYSWLSNSAISQIFQPDADQLVLVGDAETVGAGTRGFFLASVSATNGVVSWSRTRNVGYFPNSADNNDFLQHIPAMIDEHNQIIVACPGIRNGSEGSGIYKYDLNGQFIEKIALVGTGYQRYPQELMLDADGNYILVGTQRYHRQDYIPYVEKMTAGGVVLFSHQLDQPGRIFDVHFSTEGDFMVCGSFDDIETAADILSRQAFMSRMDPLTGFVPGWIEGKVFFDDNYNCQWDTGEIALPHWPISIDAIQLALWWLKIA